MITYHDYLKGKYETSISGEPHKLSKQTAEQKQE